MDGVATVQAQFLDMIVDGQGDDGAVSDITPTVWQLGAMQPSDASWGSAFPTMAYQVCEGDDEFFMFCPEPVLANNRCFQHQENSIAKKVIWSHHNGLL